MSTNCDTRTVSGFGKEWSRFDQSTLSGAELQAIFGVYFSLFPWQILPRDAEGFDLGCGSGRWARFAAPKVGRLHCIDPSAEALQVARQNLLQAPNCTFHLASAADIPLADNSMDFGYSLGVLHHIPDTEMGIRCCVAKLKTGAPLLLYLYYAFDNQPAWYRLVWRISDLLRRFIASTPFAVRYIISQAFALCVYWPLARAAGIAERLGKNVHSFLLASYRHRSFYTMRTDALDRFGTGLEHRFTRSQIQNMMERAGLERISYREAAPFWCAIGYRKSMNGASQETARRNQTCVES